jgi:3'-5' exoribonuclease
MSSRQNLKNLHDGDTVDEIYLLSDKQLRANRNANLYLLAQLRDSSGQMNGLMWNVTEDSVAHMNAGDFVKVKGKVQLYQGALQVIVAGINSVPANGLDVNDFYPQTGEKVEELSARLTEILLAIEDPDIRILMECYLADEPLMRNVCRAPAGVKTHHAHYGGLIEHIVNIAESALKIHDLYPAVDLSLLLAGVFLHDIGKVREMAYETSFVYTDEGQLLGHLVIAVEMLNEKLADFDQRTGKPFPEEAALRIKHMIVSHHGSYEFGSPKLPMTPEAIALHHLDNLDAKVNEFAREIDEDPVADSHWTPFNPRLSRKLFKGRRADEV